MPPLTRVSCYNTALSYKGDAASDAQHPPPPCHHCTQWGDRQNSHITLSTVEWKKGLSLNIGYSRAATCAFFTNLARWKFPYENRLVEISRESYDNLVYDRCRSYSMSSTWCRIFMTGYPSCCQPMLKTFTGPHPFFSHQLYVLCWFSDINTD